MSPLKNCKTCLLSAILPFLLLIVPLVATVGCGDDEQSRSTSSSPESTPEEVPTGEPSPTEPTGETENDLLGKILEMVSDLLCNTVGFEDEGGIIVTKLDPTAGTSYEVVTVNGYGVGKLCSADPETASSFSLKDVAVKLVGPVDDDCAIIPDESGQTHEPIAITEFETEKSSKLQFKLPKETSNLAPSTESQSFQIGIQFSLESDAEGTPLALFYDLPDSPEGSLTWGCLLFDYTVPYTVDEVKDVIDDVIDLGDITGCDVVQTESEGVLVLDCDDENSGPVLDIPVDPATLTGCTVEKKSEGILILDCETTGEKPADLPDLMDPNILTDCQVTANRDGIITLDCAENLPKLFDPEIFTDCDVKTEQTETGKIFSLDCDTEEERVDLPDLVDTNLFNSGTLIGCDIQSQDDGILTLDCDDDDASTPADLPNLFDPTTFTDCTVKKEVEGILTIDCDTTDEEPADLPNLMDPNILTDCQVTATQDKIIALDCSTTDTEVDLPNLFDPETVTNCDVKGESEGIFSINCDAVDEELVATGLDDATAVAVDPATGNVWVSVSAGGDKGYQDLLRIKTNGAKTTFVLSLHFVDNLDFDQEGNLLISAGDCIKKASVAENDDLTISDVICLSDNGSFNGIGVTPSNEIIVAVTRKGIYGIDSDGVIRTIVEDLSFTPMDLTVDPTGRIFFTSDGASTLMEALPDGSVQAVWEGDDINTPTAVGLNWDGSLLVNDDVIGTDYYNIIKTDGTVWMEGLDRVDMGGISSDPTGQYVAILDRGSGNVYRRAVQ